MNVLDASCRMAFGALIHDLGKLAQRAEKKGSSGLSVLFDKREDMGSNREG
jgi:hypothetical protein